MRFTIRDVLWLTVVVARGLAWWIDRSHLSETSRKWRFFALTTRLRLEEEGQQFRWESNGQPWPPDGDLEPATPNRP